MLSFFHISANLLSVLKVLFLYGFLSFVFSLLGLLHPDSYLIGNPFEVSSVSIEHILGHVVWGLAIGFFAFGFRYLIFAGLFPLILDSDHFIQFFGIDAFPRIAHSIIFSIIVALFFFFIYKNKDYKLVTVSFLSVFSHISFDVFLGNGSEFPLLFPLNLNMFYVPFDAWFYLELSSVISMILVSALVRRKNYTHRYNHQNN